MGREVETQSIRRLLAAARLGRSDGCLFTGEPGVGKSCLLMEAAELAEGMAVLRAWGREADSRVPFGGLLELLRPAFGDLPRIPAPQREALEAALALGPGTAPGRFAVGAGVLSLLCRYAEDRPLLVVLDDLQWLDAPTRDALAFAIGRLADDPVAVVAAARPEPPTGTLGLPERPLLGLSREESFALLESLAGPPVPTGEAAQVFQATGGNPLAIHEFARNPREARAAYPEGPLGAPEAVTNAFAARVTGLDDTARTVLLTVAVAGSDIRTVTAGCERLGLTAGEVAGAIDAGEESGLLVLDGDALEFRHPLVRSTVYARATPAARRRTHAAVAASLPEQDGDQRAWHLAESVVLPDEAVATALDGVALRSAARGAYAVASMAHERAAQLSPGPVRARTRLLAGAQAAWLSGDAVRTRDLLDVATDIHRPSVAELSLRGTLAAHTLSGDDACALLVQAARGCDDPDQAVALLADAAHDCFYIADGATARNLALDLEKLLPMVTTDASAVLGRMALGMSRIHAGIDEGIGEVRAAQELLTGRPDLVDELLRQDPQLVGNPHRLCWLLPGPLWLRDAAGQGLRESVSRLRSGAALGVLPCLLFQIARDQATTDRWSLAEASYRESVRFARETGQTRDLVLSLTGLSWLVARCGREDDARACIAQAHEVDPEGRVGLARLWELFAAGEMDLARGRAPEALAELDRLDARERETGFVDVDVSPGPERAEALCHLGRTEEALAVAAEHSERAVRKKQPWAMARAERALGLTVPDDDMDGHFTAALALHARTLDGFETARTRLVYGERLRRVRRRRDAREQLRRAVAVFDAVGAAPWAERATAELAATGETVQRTDLGAVGRLTPQELQVASLLADGRTTREAAAALFLSPKTVEYHLRKAYVKLGINSREALADALATTPG